MKLLLADVGQWMALNVANAERWTQWLFLGCYFMILTSFDFSFPVISFDKRPKLLGTAFFCRIADRIFLVTVKHILENQPDSQIRLLNTKNTSEYLSFSKLCALSTIDFAFCEVSSSSIIQIGIEPLDLLESLITPGQDVFTACYPIPACRITEKHLFITPMTFKGYISAANVMVEHSSNFDHNYILSGFRIYKGLSGAPLITNINGHNVCCGIIYGDQSAEYYLSFIEDNQSISGNDRIEKYEKDSFGLAAPSFELIRLIRENISIIK